jgi:hypothetical protein
VALDRPDLAQRLTVVREPRRLPAVLSVEEVTLLLQVAPGPKYKAAFATAGACPRAGRRPDPWGAGRRERDSSWSAAEEEEFKPPIRAQYETQGHPYYASARLWDDGVIDPAGSGGLLVAAHLF